MLGGTTANLIAIISQCAPPSFGSSSGTLPIEKGGRGGVRAVNLENILLIFSSTELLKERKASVHSAAIQIIIPVMLCKVFPFPP